VAFPWFADIQMAPVKYKVAQHYNRIFQ